MHINHKQRIIGLDLIRAVAILLVMISHSTILLAPESDSTSIAIVQFFGAVGVDLFFVLSGYLIGGILLMQLENDQTNFRHLLHFWRRRWFRTLPNYFLILLVNSILFFTLFDESIPNLGAYPLFLQNFASPHPNFFTEAWSLSIEEYSYIFGPFLLYVLLFFFGKSQRKKLFLLSSLVMILAGLAFRFHFHFETITEDNGQWSQSVRKVVIYRLDAIYYGFLAVYVSYYFRGFWKKIGTIASVLGSSIFLGMHAVMFIFELLPTTTPLFYNVWYLPLLGMSLLLFFPKASTMSIPRRFATIVTKISLWSYALYLVNFSIVLLSIQQLIDVQKLDFTLKTVTLGLYWLISFILAYLLYRFYERPTTDLRDRKGITNIL